MNGILFKPDMIKAIRDGRKTVTRRLSGLKEINIEPDKWLLPPVYNYANKSWEFTTPNYETISVKPRYKVGEGVYIKEAHYAYGEWHKEEIGWVFHRDKDMAVFFDSAIWEHALKGHTGQGWFRRSPLFLPEKDARDFIKIASVRPERLQNITEEDAMAEGANPFLLDKLEGGTKYRMLKTYHHEYYPLVDHADEGEIVVFECPNMGFARLHHTQWKDGQEPVFSIPAKEVFDYVGALEPNYKNGFGILWDSINPKYPWSGNPWLWRYGFVELKK